MIYRVILMILGASFFGPFFSAPAKAQQSGQIWGAWTFDNSLRQCNELEVEYALYPNGYIYTMGNMMPMIVNKSTVSYTVEDENGRFDVSENLRLISDDVLQISTDDGLVDYYRCPAHSRSFIAHTAALVAEQGRAEWLQDFIKDGFDPEIAPLLALYESLDGSARGIPPENYRDDEKFYEPYFEWLSNERELVAEMLGIAGYCKAKKSDKSMSEMWWHRCTANSIRPKRPL